MQSKIVETVKISMLNVHQPMELPVTGKLLPPFPELAVLLLEPRGSIPIWLLLAGVLRAELPKLSPGGAPPLKAF